MTDVYANIQAGKYENTAKWPVGNPNDPVIAKMRISCREEQDRIDNEFYVDVCKDLGLDPNKESTKKLFQKAYDDGHGFGYENIYTHLVDLNAFVNEYNELRRAEK